MKKLLTLIITIVLLIDLNYVHAWIFTNFKDWNYSSWRNKFDISYEVLKMIPVMDDKTSSKYHWYNLADINWDWLVDVLYYSYEFQSSSNWYNSLRYLAILHNTWDYNFWIWYKCVEQFSTNWWATIPRWFYGDCAQ